MTSLLALAARYVLVPFARLWAWLAADPIRLAFAFLLALCAFLGWRLSAVDADRDNWRDQVRAIEDASQIVEDADALADAEALDVADQSKGTINDANTRAEAAAANDADDPLRAGINILRAEGARRSDKTSR